MRPSCLSCARKHLAQALVLIHESHKGYPDHRWLAIGHLAEAEDELLAKFPAQASSVRNHRKLFEDTDWHVIPIMDIINELTILDKEVKDDDGKRK